MATSNPSSVHYTTSMAALHDYNKIKFGIGGDYITDLCTKPPRQPPPRPPRWPPLPTSRHSRGTSLPPLVIPNNASPAPRPLSELRPQEAPPTAFLNFSLPRPVACRKKSSVDITTSKATHLSVANENSTHGESNYFSSNASRVPPPPRSSRQPSTPGPHQIPPPRLPRRPSTPGPHQKPLRRSKPKRPLSSKPDSSPPRPLSSGSDHVPELEPDVYNDDVSSISDAAQTPPPPSYAPPLPPVKPPPRPWSVMSSYSVSTQVSCASSSSQLHRSRVYPGKRNPPPRINFRPSPGYYHHSSKSVPNFQQRSNDSTDSGDNSTTSTRTKTGRRQPKTYKLDARSSRVKSSPSDIDLDDPVARECSKAEAEAFTKLVGIIDRFNAREGGSPYAPNRVARRVSSLHLRVATPVFDPADERRELWAKGLRVVSPTVYVADVESVWGMYFDDEDTPL